LLGQCSTPTHGKAGPRTKGVGKTITGNAISNSISGGGELIGRSLNVFLRFLTILSLAVGAGCAESEPTRGNSHSSTPVSSEPSENEAAGTTEIEAFTASGSVDREPAEVTVRIADEKDFEELLKENEGKVVLVDFWALWCGPCKDLFPHTVELHERHKERGLVVISVNFDSQTEEQRVLDFLVSQKATFQNLISKYDVGPKSFEAFEIEGGNVPYFKLYDRSGKLHTTLGHTQESIEPADIDEAVERLLDEA
jgi:thiol-disulfide isomerase/thioredoxin